MEIEIYSDETFINEKYMGIGCLFVPIHKKQEIAKYLSNLRCLNPKSHYWTWNFRDCPIKCREEYHKNNNCEIHHAKISKKASHPRRTISKKWIEFLIQNNKNNKELIYFNILYIDKSKLDDKFFGDKTIDDNVYNRFYRSSIKYTKFFFGNRVIIKNIFHDNSDNKEKHEYFPWHTSHRLNIDKTKIKVENNIQFLDSDHKIYFSNDKSSYVFESQFIQFIDLILGVTSQILFSSSNDSAKSEIACIVYPLIERLMKKPENINSSYNYFKKQNISIFPKDEINYSKTLDEKIQREFGQFHRNIKFKKPDIISDSESLDKWFS
ncbi:MAG: hypothetical protein LBC39_03990 [Methanobrevibacter sp.]|jgi:hypothetical protein|nr:hypothetical protein [Candidatus Methanovirga aequatorialis]